MTGMSASGMSSVLAIIGRRGYRTIDTDTDEWCEWGDAPDATSDWIWCRSAIERLLRWPCEGGLIVSGCKTNKGDFYDRFDEVVLLSAPVEALMTRV